MSSLRNIRKILVPVTEPVQKSKLRPLPASQTIRILKEQGLIRTQIGDFLVVHQALHIQNRSPRRQGQVLARHPDHKIVTSTPNGGPRQAKSGGKPKDSTNTNDSVSYGKGYGDRSPVGNPTVKKRSDVVPPDSSMIHPDNNPKRRESAYAGVGRESLKDVKKLSNRGSA